MITPLAAQNRQVLQQIDKDARANGTARKQAAPARGTPTHLADSIMADGGLEFLRSHLEEKLGAIFDAATADDPEAAAAGPAAFYDTATDVSPDATADRIVSFALGLRNAFSRQNPDLDETDLMTRFEAEVRHGIESGFKHARDTLGDLDLLTGNVADNVDATWAAVQQKLADFFHPSDGE